MIRTILLWLSGFLVSATLAYGQGSMKKQPAVQTPYSFMGLTVGHSKAEAVAVIDAMNSANDSFSQFEPPICKTDAPGLSGPGLEICVFSVKYASLPAYAKSHSFALLLVDDKIASINYDFDRNKYEAMVQAIVKKYGAPRSSRQAVVQNQIGATFQGKDYVWSNAISQIRANEYGTTLDKSTIHVEDSKLLREFEKRAKDNGPKI